MEYLGSLVPFLSLWGLDKAFFSTPVPFIFARQGWNHYTFYLDTPYIPFNPSFCLVSFPVVSGCGSKWASPFGDFFSLPLSARSSARRMTHDYDEQGAHLEVGVKRWELIAWMGLCRQVLWSIVFGRCCYDLLESGL